jgi:lipopolysaccharide/colanic/teichoic acid biosynthesis glycosyltransferase
MKRAFDLSVAVMLVIVLCPIMAMIALAVQIDGSGPILHRGIRVGCRGAPFMMLKFRTMVPDAKPSREITVHGDPRITRIGRVLRAAKLDELPQLINVLHGDMSLVGPRPESPRYVAHYTEEQRAVLTVRPGITGPSQVLFRHEEQLLCVPVPELYYLTVVMPAKLAIDLEYVRSHSLWGDIKIIVLTARSIVWPLEPPVLPAPVGQAQGATAENASQEAGAGGLTQTAMTARK